MTQDKVTINKVDISSEFEDMHKRIIQAIQEADSNNTIVAVIVLGRILTELAVMSGIPKEDIINGVDGSYDMAEEELDSNGQEVH